jgi:hypothetical protein
LSWGCWPSKINLFRVVQILQLKKMMISMKNGTFSCARIDVRIWNGSAWKTCWLKKNRDGFGSNTHEYEFRCHYLPHFISHSDTNTDIIKYKYKTDILNSHSNI